MISSGKKIGVDAGTTLVKVVGLAKAGDGMALASWSFVPFRSPDGSSPELVRRAQAGAIDAAIKKGECKCRDIVLGIPGNSAFIRNIKLPPVPASKVDQIVRYEIQQTIPFPIENIALDYQVLEPGESSEVEVIMVAMKGETAETLIKDVEHAKVKVGIMDSIPLALYNCYRYNGYSLKEECTAIIELGATTTNILIELDGDLRYCRSVSIGGNAITEAIAKEFNIPFPQAERIKIQHGLIFPEDQQSNFNEDQVRVSKAIAGVLDRLRSEIKLTVGYFRSLTGATAISRAVLAGGTAMLKNIRPFLAEWLGVPVEILNPFRRIGVPKNHVNARRVAPILAGAVGLALRSSQECCELKISLIPPKVKEAKSRQGRIICNAVSLLLLVGIIALYLWRMIPEAGQRAQKIAELDEQIAKYEEFEDTLTKLQENKELLRTEYNLYSSYSNAAVDVVTPFAILKDSVDRGAWIESILIKKSAVTIGGISQGGNKVESLRQLSALRSRLGKYCEKVKVKGQKEYRDSVVFSLQLQGLVNLPEFLKAQESANKQKDTGEVEKESQKKAEKKGEDSATVKET